MSEVELLFCMKAKSAVNCADGDKFLLVITDQDQAFALQPTFYAWRQKAVGIATVKPSEPAKAVQNRFAVLSLDTFFWQSKRKILTE